jgi:hypothetical protein
MGGLELAGWLLFLLSGVAFLISGLLTRDVWVIVGSVLFVAGIVAVMMARSRE